MPAENLKTVEVTEECHAAAAHVAIDEGKRIKDVVEDALRAYRPVKKYLEMQKP